MSFTLEIEHKNRLSEGDMSDTIFFGSTDFSQCARVIIDKYPCGSCELMFFFLLEKCEKHSSVALASLGSFLVFLEKPTCI